jgi:TRAP transporter TAXI family solute receptor
LPPALSRRTATALIAWVTAGGMARGQTARFFRIGTGSVSGTYYPIGGLVADIISNPPGSRPCERGGDCGVPDLVALAQTSDGSIANIRAIESGDLESGFAQSDAAYGAFTGTGVFAGQAPARQIRALANLYPESVHLVAHVDAGIETVRDLGGKKVSLDRDASGTQADARLILQAFGVGDEVVRVGSLSAGEAIDSLAAGDIDAFFIVAGWPAAGVVELADANLIRLVPIAGPEVGMLIREHPFFAVDLIPAGTYLDQPAVETISVGAQWLVAASLEEELVYDIARAFWRPEAREILDQGHPKGKAITLETALEGVGIPLHPGAERYYREVGLIR